MASSSKKPYNRSFSPNSTTTTQQDNSSDVSLPLQYDTEEDLNKVFESIEEELRGRTEVKWKLSGNGGVNGKGNEKDKDVILRLVMQDFYAKIIPNIKANCSIGGVPYNEYIKTLASKSSGEIEPFSNELHERVVKYQDVLFNTRADNVNKRKDLPLETVEALKLVFEEDLERLERLESERIEFLEKKVVSKPRRSIGGANGKPNSAQVQADFEFGKSTLDNLLEKVPLLITSTEQTTQVTKDAALVD